MTTTEDAIMQSQTSDFFKVRIAVEPNKVEHTSPETFEFAADLLRSGINVSKIYKKVLQIKPRASFELSKLAMDRIEFLEDNGM